MGNASPQEVVKTTGLRGFLVWINFPESDFLKVCKVKMAFKCILTGHLRWKRKRFFFPDFTLQETLRGMCFVHPAPLQKFIGNACIKHPRTLYDFNPASAMLVPTSMHAITMRQTFCPLWDLVKRRRNYKLGNH